MLLPETITHQLSFGRPKQSAGNSCSTIISLKNALPSSVTLAICQLYTSFRLLEHFVSLVYGRNDEGVNQLRYQIFTKKQAREKKVVDLANLPQCQSVLRLHSMRANTVAYIWRNSGSSQCEIPPLSECGWSNDGQIIWIASAFPSDVEDLLFEEGYNEDVYEYGSDVDSEDDFN